MSGAGVKRELVLMTYRISENISAQRALLSPLGHLGENDQTNAHLESKGFHMAFE